MPGELYWEFLVIFSISIGLLLFEIGVMGDAEIPLASIMLSLAVGVNQLFETSF